MKSLARAGAVAYVLWGVLHLASAQQVYLAAGSMEPGILQGRVYQDAWNLLCFSIAAIVVAISLNWKNSRAGYWINLIMVSATDIGFIVTILVPGHMPWVPGILGPVLWILAALFSTMGIRMERAARS